MTFSGKQEGSHLETQPKTLKDLATAILAMTEEEQNRRVGIFDTQYECASTWYGPFEEHDGLVCLSDEVPDDVWKARVAEVAAAEREAGDGEVPATDRRSNGRTKEAVAVMPNVNNDDDETLILSDESLDDLAEEYGYDEDRDETGRQERAEEDDDEDDDEDDPDMYPHDDSPSLDPPWWYYR
jgi:hypothetical protein